MIKKGLVIIIFCFAFTANAQLGRLTKSHSQWWLGVMGGTNNTQAIPLQRFGVIESLSGENFDKNYSSSGLYGSQLGMILTYDIFAGIAVSIQPKLINYKFGYTSEYSWIDAENSFNDFSVEFHHENKLQYVQIPLYIKYDFIPSNFIGGSKKKDLIKPFIQFGGAYSFLTNAQKIVTEKGESNSNTYEKSSTTLDVSSQFISTEWQLQTGGGVNLDINSFRFAFVFNYHWGLNNIVEVNNRYSYLQQTSDVYDVYDDVILRGWSASVEAIFPLKFIYDPHFRKSK